MIVGKSTEGGFGRSNFDVRGERGGRGYGVLVIALYIGKDGNKTVERQP